MSVINSTNVIVRYLQVIVANVMQRLIDEEPKLRETSGYVFRDPILYGDYRNALELGEPRIYEDLQDYEAAKALLEQILAEYNESNTPMNLVLFDDAIEHATRVHRFLFIFFLRYTGGLQKWKVCDINPISKK